MAEHTRTLTLYDRSRTTTDWSCPRKRYYQYEFKGKGIVSAHSPLELFLGTVLHDGLAVIASMHKDGAAVDIDLIASTAFEQVTSSLLADSTGEADAVEFAYEQAALIEGLLRGFYKHAWPRLLSQYPEIIHIEKELTFTHDGLTFMSRPDLILADKTGGLWYIEYKSTSSKKEGWVNSWATAVQLHSTVKAIEQTLGELPMGVIVQGLYKGYESYGKQSSPFCYGYGRPGTPPFTKPDLRYDYAQGYKRTPVWEQPGGVKGWVEAMPPAMLGDQFPQVPPIFVKEDLVNAFFLQRSYREHEISLANQMLAASQSEEEQEGILAATFPQKFEQCRPYFGKSCSYLQLCHGHITDPIKEGFTWREPHHDLEVEQDAKEEV